MEFVYVDERLTERAPNLFSPLFVKGTDKGATLLDVADALRRGETVTIRQLDPIEAAWAEENTVIYEMMQELTLRRQMLYAGMVQLSQGVNPDVVVDRFRATGVEPEELAQALSEALQGIQQEGANGAA